MKAQWKDVTRYTDDPDEKPTTWEIIVKECRICITTVDPVFAGEWVMNCDSVGIHSLPLELHDGIDFEHAAEKAVHTARLKAQRILTSITNMEN